MNALGKTHQSSGYNMTLGRLLEGLDVAAPHGLQVTDLVQDSRAATPGCVFLACPGRTTHGLMHAATAVERGAVAVLWEPGADLEPPVLPERVAAIAIPHLSRHVGELADRFFRRPSADLRVAGITGTNGKTTTAFLLAQASDLLGRRGWYGGTLGHGHPGTVRDAGLTTPDAVIRRVRIDCANHCCPSN
jgi:UDP-N-acetylmuramoyl-L-alanyl-D-glutamate--2,6-diaminopimelate ligase